MCGARRLWLIRLAVNALLMADMVLLTATSQFQDGLPTWRLWIWLPLALVIFNAPYVAAMAGSLCLFRRFSVALWLVSVSVMVVGAASLYLRWADYSIARQAWEAKQAGMHFMCCAPPGRLVALLLDYTLLGTAGGLAGLIALVSTLVKEHGAALRRSCSV